MSGGVDIGGGVAIGGGREVIEGDSMEEDAKQRAAAPAPAPASAEAMAAAAAAAAAVCRGEESRDPGGVHPVHVAAEAAEGGGAGGGGCPRGWARACIIAARSNGDECLNTITSSTDSGASSSRYSSTTSL